MHSCHNSYINHLKTRPKLQYFQRGCIDVLNIYEIQRVLCKVVNTIYYAERIDNILLIVFTSTTGAD